MGLFITVSLFTLVTAYMAFELWEQFKDIN